MPDINRAYTWCIQTCNAPNVGYSNGYREQQTVNGVTYYDCSSLMFYALKSGGFPVGNGGAFYTSNMLGVLQAVGFRQVPITGPWLPGDILHRYSGQLADPLNDGHTEMVYQQGDFNGQGRAMGAHWYISANYPTLQDTVSIDNYIATYQMYTSLWRYGSGADEDHGAYFEGSTKYTVAAICAVWRYKTHLNPGYMNIDAQDPDNTAYGMAAWTGQRGQDYIAYYHNAGTQFHDGDTQVDYFLQDSFWDTDNTNYQDLSAFLDARTTDFDELITEFLGGYYSETIDQTTLAVLHSYAVQMFDYIDDNANDTSIISWYYGSNNLTASEMLNNAVLLYRRLSAGGGGGGTPTVPTKKRLKAWFYIRYHNIKK